MENKIKKIILLVLVAAFAAAPFQVNALAPVVSTRVPIELKGEGLFEGITGGITDTGSTACLGADTITDQVGSLLSQGLSLLGENTTQILALQTQLGIVKGAITCWTGVVSTVTATGNVTGTSLVGITKSNATKQQALDHIVGLKAIQKQLEARIQLASQGFWKAVLVGLLLKQTDKLSEKLVSELTEKFKINDYSRYVGAITDTVYTNSMILRYVDNDKDRAIVRSMIQNPFLRTRTHPSIEAAADAYVGFDVSNISFGDPKFWQGVGKIANGEEYKKIYQSAMISKTDEIIAKARQAAMAEVSQSGGYKSTLNNCGPSISKQKQKDLQYKQILDEIKDREKLQESIKASPNATEVEKDKIRKEVKDTRSKLEKFTDVFGAAAIHICEGTNTPAAKFKDTIQDLIGSQIQKFSDYNDNNLPLVQKLVIDIADNLVGKFVIGGNKGLTGDLINESVITLTSGIAASLPKPSNGINSTIPTFGQDAPAGTPGNVAGDSINLPSIVVMPRGPSASFR